MPIDALAAPHTLAPQSLSEGILPVGITSRTVTTGPWTLPDGTVATGRATITCPVNLVHTPTGQPLASGDMSVRLVSGMASWDLCPTDQPGLNRVDWTYTLRVELNGALTQPDPVSFILPASGPATVDLDPMSTVPSTAGTPVAPIMVTTVNGQTGDVVITTSSNAVSSVNSKTGDVVLSASDVGADASGAATAAQAFAAQRSNHTGTQSADTLTDGSTNKAFLATERTKLTGIASGATANSTDATLLARANHTGTQAASTVTGLAAVATSGAYTDLSAKPTIPTVGAAGAGAAVALSSTDASVTNSRTPTAHATTHASGGSDPITPAAIGAEVSGAAATAQAFAIQRANHTGTQAATTITGLATVATTGAYSDLSGKPAIPADATTTAKGIVQLAGDLAGTAAAPTVPGLAGKVGSTTITTLTVLTQAAYDALGSKSTTTLYVIQG